MGRTPLSVKINVPSQSCQLEGTELAVVLRGEPGHSSRAHAEDTGSRNNKMIKYFIPPIISAYLDSTTDSLFCYII